MKNGGAIGISVLTEPKHFMGSLNYLAMVRKSVNLPILMKDIIINPKQLDAAKSLGANAVLLIERIFQKKISEFSLEFMIEQAHLRSLEVLLETHNIKEFNHAIQTNTDLIGINNRNLESLNINLNVTKNILKKYWKYDFNDKPP